MGDGEGDAIIARGPSSAKRKRGWCERRSLAFQIRLSSHTLGVETKDEFETGSGPIARTPLRTSRENSFTISGHAYHIYGC